MLPHVAIGLEKTSSNSETCLISKELENQETVFKIPKDHFHKISSWYRFPEWKPFVINCISCARTNQIYVTPPFTHMSPSRLNWTVLFRRSNFTVRAALLLALCESRSGRFISCAVSTIPRKVQQTLYDSLFTACQACNSSRSLPTPTPRGRKLHTCIYVFII